MRGPLTVPGHGCVAPGLRTGPLRLRTGPLSATRAARTAQADHRRPVWSASLGRPLLRRSPQGDRDRHGAGGAGRCALGSAGRAVPGRPYRRGVRWARDAAPAWPCPPAWWVGRSPATRPRAVRAREPPEDAPARGDHHRARIGVRQGPQMHAAGPSPTTPVRAPPRPATGAVRPAASEAGRSTATATCSIWSTAPGRWRRSCTGCGRPRGR